MLTWQYDEFWVYFDVLQEPEIGVKKSCLGLLYFRLIILQERQVGVKF